MEKTALSLYLNVNPVFEFPDPLLRGNETLRPFFSSIQICWIIRFLASYRHLSHWASLVWIGQSFSDLVTRAFLKSWLNPILSKWSPNLSPQWRMLREQHLRAISCMLKTPSRISMNSLGIEFVKEWVQKDMKFWPIEILPVTSVTSKMTTQIIFLLYSLYLFSNFYQYSSILVYLAAPDWQDQSFCRIFFSEKKISRKSKLMTVRDLPLIIGLNFRFHKKIMSKMISFKRQFLSTRSELCTRLANLILL